MVADLIGERLIKRAAEPDGLLNPLVRSLSGDNLFAVRWERVAQHLPGESQTAGGFQAHFILSKGDVLGREFDRSLDAAWAETQAMEAFTPTGFPSTVHLSATSKKAADFRVEWPGGNAIVEVKRSSGFAEESRIRIRGGMSCLIDAGQAIGVSHPQVEVAGSRANGWLAATERGDEVAFLGGSPWAPAASARWMRAALQAAWKVGNGAGRAYADGDCRCRSAVTGLRVVPIALLFSASPVPA